MRRAVNHRTNVCLVLSLSLLIGLFFVPCTRAYEKEIKTLADSMAKSIAKSGKKKIAVLDFTDSEGKITALGRFLAEELIVALLNTGEEFEIVDRGQLESILKEQKLSVTDLKSPQTIKTLGDLAGVEAVISGTFEESILLSGNTVDVNTTQSIDTSTGAIVKTQIITELLEIETKPEKVTVASPEQPEPPQAPKYATGIVVTQRDPLNIRNGPGQKHKVIKKAPKGQKLIILESSGEWYKVQLPDGTIGYGHSEYIEVFQQNN